MPSRLKIKIKFTNNNIEKSIKKKKRVSPENLELNKINHGILRKYINYSNDIK